MKKHLATGLVLSTGLAVGMSEAAAQSTIEFKGAQFRCQTSCQLLVNGSAWRVVDIRGGWVDIRTHRPIPTYPPTCDYFPTYC